MRQILTGLKLATLAPGDDLVSPQTGAIGIENGRIAWVGEAPADWNADLSRDFEGRLVTPALIDCHTHLVYGGNRAGEFRQRLHGATYEDIARAGGGIVSSVRATRAASEDELVAAALPRLDALLAEGVSTVEIKSGYGLDIASEIRMLSAARRLGKARPVRILTSWLAAHAVPPEYKGRPDAYIDEVAIPGLAQAHALGLVDAVDAFCETIAFDRAQVARVFAKAGELGLPIKLHAEQLSNQGGARLAAGLRALSVDHLEHLPAADCAALAEAGTVAVLLPGAYYTLRETQLPPVAALRDAGVPIAIATDSNPGTSPLTSLLLAMNMACTLFRLTPEEALAGVTLNASRALGLADELGSIAPGKRAELAIWNVVEPAELAYRVGFNPLHIRIQESLA